MKIIFIVIGLVVIAGAGWYFASPLVFDTEVNEEFPELDHIPTAEELADMSPEELEAIEESVHEMAAREPDVVMTEPMPLMMEDKEEGLMIGEGDMVMEAEQMESEEEMLKSINTEPVLLASGSFMDADSFHKGSGQAGIYQLPDGSRILRFDNFSVTNGPDLRVLLSASSRPLSNNDLSEYIELAALKGNKGDQNYEIPAGTDIDSFHSVVIYCKPFHVVFSTATLEQ
jgi:hypothetical protein